MRGNRINPVAWVGLHKGLHTSMVLLLLVCSISGSFICKNEAKLQYIKLACDHMPQVLVDFPCVFA